MLNPENATTESVDVADPTNTEQAPLSAAEQAELAALYAVEGPAAANSGETPGIEEAATVESVDTSIIGGVERLGEFSDDPAEFGAFLSRHVGETYLDPMSGETLIRPTHLEVMDEIRADIGEAIGLLKQGGSKDSIGRLVGSAWNKTDMLPSALRPHITAIMTRYYKKNDPGNQ